jgi:hypothetical protein
MATVKIKIDKETDFGKLLLEKAEQMLSAEMAYRLSGKYAVSTGKEFWNLVIKEYPDVDNGNYDHQTNEIIYYK